jgi:hypothetical protein
MNFEQLRQELLDETGQDPLLSRKIYADELEKWHKENRGLYRTKLEKAAEVYERAISRLRSEREGNT